MPVFFAYIAFILFLHLIPVGNAGADRFDLGQLRADYLVHTMLFLPWMLFSAYRVEKTNKTGRECRAMNLGGWMLSSKDIRLGHALLWMGLGILVAVATESLHYLIPYRGFNPLDAMFNTLGVLTGGVVLGCLVLARFFAKGRAVKEEAVRDE
jgi:VanZ family protein